MQTLAEDAESSRQLAAAVFFSNATVSGNEDRIVPTICYQLAVKITPFREFLTEHIRGNPRIFGKRLREQFDNLILQFFTKNPNSELGGTRVIFLDGLDELSSFDHGDPGAILRQLLASIDRLHSNTSAPFLWVVSSRSEDSIKGIFSTISQIGLTEWHIPADSEDDVILYLRDSFLEIRRLYPNMIHREWPSCEEFSIITTSAGGLFVYASTLIKFINDSHRRNPVAQLNNLLPFLCDPIRTQPTATKPSPFLPLDKLYTQILTNIHTSVLPNTLRLLGYALFKLESPSSWSLASASNLLAFERHVAYDALEKFGSVLEIPNVDNAGEERFRILHSSFAEYLLSPTRSGDFVLNVDETNTHVWWCYFRILQEANNTGQSIARSLG